MPFLIPVVFVFIFVFPLLFITPMITLVAPVVLLIGIVLIVPSVFIGMVKPAAVVSNSMALAADEPGTAEVEKMEPAPAVASSVFFIDVFIGFGDLLLKFATTIAVFIDFIGLGDLFWTTIEVFIAFIGDFG